MKYFTQILNEKKTSELKKSIEKKRKDRSIYTKSVFKDAMLEDNVLKLFFESENKIHGSGNKHQQQIIFENIDNNIDKKTLLEIFKNNDIKVNCDCEDFLYAGYKYIGTIQQYSIEKETRKPNIRNPELKGSVCKHLNSVLSKLHLHVDKILEKLEK